MILKNPLVRLAAVLLILGAIVVGRSQFSAAERERDNSLHLWFFNVGQGDSILFDTPQHHQVLIDGGPDKKVLPELSKALPLTDKDLDLVILTHNHADHLTGLIEVLRHYRVHELWISGAIHTTDTYRKFLEVAKEKQIKTKVIQAGARYEVDGLRGVALFPLINMTGEMPSNQHDANLTTFWQYGSQTVLLTGDAEDQHEQQQLDRGIVRNVTIMKLGHHGSRTSTSEAYLDALKPLMAVISGGKNNKFGHPHPETLAKLTGRRIPFLRTDQEGTILFSLWPDRFEFKTGQ